MTAVSAAPSPHAGMGFAQFVCMIAALMALGALGIRRLLPNLPVIAHAPCGSRTPTASS